MILKRLDRGGDGDTLTVLVNVPDAKSNGEATTKAVEAAETLASGPGAGWRVTGHVGWASGGHVAWASGDSEAFRQGSGTDK